jgi:hypothetical protein
MIIAITMDLSRPIDRMLLGWPTLTSGRKSGCPQIESISDELAGILDLPSRRNTRAVGVMADFDYPDA